MLTALENIWSSFSFVLFTHFCCFSSLGAPSNPNKETETSTENPSLRFPSTHRVTKTKNYLVNIRINSIKFTTATDRDHYSRYRCVYGMFWWSLLANKTMNYQYFKSPHGFVTQYGTKRFFY